MDIKNALAGGGLLVASIAGTVGFLAGGLAGEQVEPVEQITGAPEEKAIALAVCQNDEPYNRAQTTFKQVRTPITSRYEAKYDTPDLRIDLTWQVDGDSIAVEETKGRDFNYWAETITTDFQACVSTKTIPVQDELH